jgi:hypothetical protein
MSHLTKLDRAQITDPEAFVTACKELGFNGEVLKNHPIFDAQGENRTVADVAVKVGDYDWMGHKRTAWLALERNKTTNKFDMVSDWWAVRKFPQAAKFRGDGPLQDALLQKTTQHTITSMYRRRGFMAHVKTDEAGKIVVSLTR